MKLLEPLALAGRTAPNRLLFGPHETNLARRRSISDRHVAYYARRAAGGAGIVVCEEASVHDSDWPYERAPLARDCEHGWRAVADAVHAEGALALAAVGHAGGQGSSAYSQAPLWAPSRVPEVNSREVPKWMEADDIAAVLAGFGAAASVAVDAGLDGVEVNAGQFSLVRQFLSGLTNHRGDEWGTDRVRFAREVLEATRRALGPDHVLGLRLCADELAPWAGLTPESAADVAVELASLVDYLVVVRGSIFTASATRPDLHAEPGFNIELCRQVRTALRAAGHEVPVVLQGSVVDPGQAEWALAEGVCDAVEMTRAQIADPAVGAKLAVGAGDRVRPCVLCNQLCQVRDARNPIVSCIGEPSSGHELDDPSPVADVTAQAALGSPADGATSGGAAPEVLVVGGGPAGLEAARVAALRGAHVRLVDAAETTGGMVRTGAFGAGRARLALLTDWLARECRHLGVEVVTGRTVTDEEIGRALADGVRVVLANGSVDGERPYRLEPAAALRAPSAARFLAEHADDLPSGPVVVLDPIGGPIGVSIAELLAAREGDDPVHLVTQDNIAANELARTGDLAPANVRLQQVGVHIERRSIVRSVRCTEAGLEVEVEDRFSGVRRTIGAVWVVDAGFRLPAPAPAVAEPGVAAGVIVVGDAVAPRTVAEAVLEGRRASAALTGPAVDVPAPSPVGEGHA